MSQTLGDRIEAALIRIQRGHADMRVPADPTDPDLVLVDCAAHIAELERRLVTARAEGERAGREAALKEAANLMRGQDGSCRFCSVIEHRQNMCECEERADAILALLDPAEVQADGAGLSEDRCVGCGVAFSALRNQQKHWEFSAPCNQQKHWDLSRGPFCDACHRVTPLVSAQADGASE